jgi:hypothetical protein
MTVFWNELSASPSKVPSVDDPQRLAETSNLQ